MTGRLDEGGKIAAHALSSSRSELRSQSDAVLASLVTADVEAFAELYRRYQNDICRFVRASVRTTSAAEDLTAEVFFKALRSAASYDGRGSYAGWLFQIARNSLSSWHRRGKHHLALGDGDDPIDPDPCPATRVVDAEASERVWTIVAHLPESQRDAIALRYLSDLRIDEIALLTDSTEGAIRALLHRARNNLRREYGERYR